MLLNVGEDTYYYVTNPQGDVMALEDSNCVPVVSYDYTAYGVVAVLDHDENDYAEINPLTYRGYVFDVETGLYYVSSRYYDPDIGRWITPEPNVYDGAFDDNAGLLGYNTYTYCANNPVIYCDLTGEALEYASAVLIAQCIVVVVGVVVIGALLLNIHRTLKNGSKKKTNDKHTKPRPGRESEKKKQKNGWKRRK